MSAPFFPDRPKPVRNASLDWLLWWRIDADQLDHQVREYRTLRLWQSMRGISALCLLVSAVITIALLQFAAAKIDPTAYIDVGLMTGVAIFVYFGHRWAMIAAMLLWTLEKAVGLVDSGGLGVAQIFWWTGYMHAFFFAFRIEQVRRRTPQADVEVFT